MIGFMGSKKINYQLSFSIRPSQENAILNEVEEEDNIYFSDYFNSSKFETPVSSSKNETGELRRRKRLAYFNFKIDMWNVKFCIGMTFSIIE